MNKSFMNKVDGKEMTMHKLKYLDIRRNAVKDVLPDPFRQLPKDMFLVSDRFVISSICIIQIE